MAEHETNPRGPKGRENSRKITPAEELLYLAQEFAIEEHPATFYAGEAKIILDAHPPLSFSQKIAEVLRLTKYPMGIQEAQDIADLKLSLTGLFLTSSYLGKERVKEKQWLSDDEMLTILKSPLYEPILSAVGRARRVEDISYKIRSFLNPIIVLSPESDDEIARKAANFKNAGSGNFRHKSSFGAMAVSAFTELFNRRRNR